MKRGSAPRPVWPTTSFVAKLAGKIKRDGLANLDERNQQSSSPLEERFENRRQHDTSVAPITRSPAQTANDSPLKLDHSSSGVVVGSNPHQHSEASGRPQSPQQRHELLSLQTLRASAKHGLHEAAAAALSDTTPNFPGSLGYGYSSNPENAFDKLGVQFRDQSLDSFGAGITGELEGAGSHFMMQLQGGNDDNARSPTNLATKKEGWEYRASPAAGRNNFTERRSPLEYQLESGFEYNHCASSPWNGVSASGTGMAGALAHLALVVSEEKHWGRSFPSSNNLTGSRSKTLPRQHMKQEQARARGLEELAHASEAAAKALQGLQLANEPETPARSGVQASVGGVMRRSTKASKADALAEAWEWQPGHYRSTDEEGSSGVGWASRPVAQVLVAAILLGHRHCQHEHQEGNGAPLSSGIRGSSTPNYTSKDNLTAEAAQWALAAVDAASQALCVVMRAAAEANDASYGDESTRSGKNNDQSKRHTDANQPSASAKLPLPQWIVASGVAEACRAALETCLNIPHLVPGHLPSSSSRASRLAAKKAAAQSKNQNDSSDEAHLNGARKPEPAASKRNGGRRLAASAAADAQCTRQLPSGCLELLAATASALALPSSSTRAHTAASQSSRLEWLHHLATAPVQANSSASEKSAPKWPVSRALLPLLSRTLQLFDLSVLGMSSSVVSSATNPTPAFAAYAGTDVANAGGRSPNHTVTIAEEEEEEAFEVRQVSSDDGSDDVDEDSFEEVHGSNKEQEGIVAQSPGSPQRGTGSPTTAPAGEEDLDREARRKAAARLRIVHRADRFRRSADAATADKKSRIVQKALNASIAFKESRPDHVTAAAHSLRSLDRHGKVNASLVRPSSAPAQGRCVLPGDVSNAITDTSRNTPNSAYQGNDYVGNSNEEPSHTGFGLAPLPKSATLFTRPPSPGMPLMANTFTTGVETTPHLRISKPGQAASSSNKPYEGISSEDFASARGSVLAIVAPTVELAQRLVAALDSGLGEKVNHGSSKGNSKKFNSVTSAKPSTEMPPTISGALQLLMGRDDRPGRGERDILRPLAKMLHATTTATTTEHGKFNDTVEVFSEALPPAAVATNAGSLGYSEDEEAQCRALRRHSCMLTLRLASASVKAAERFSAVAIEAAYEHAGIKETQSSQRKGKTRRNVSDRSSVANQSESGGEGLATLSRAVLEFSNDIDIQSYVRDALTTLACSQDRIHCGASASLSRMLSSEALQRGQSVPGDNGVASNSSAEPESFGGTAGLKSNDMAGIDKSWPQEYPSVGALAAEVEYTNSDFGPNGLDTLAPTSRTVRNSNAQYPLAGGYQLPDSDESSTCTPDSSGGVLSTAHAPPDESVQPLTAAGLVMNHQQFQRTRERERPQSAPLSKNILGCLSDGASAKATALGIKGAKEKSIEATHAVMQARMALTAAEERKLHGRGNDGGFEASKLLWSAKADERQQWHQEDREDLQKLRVKQQANNPLNEDIERHRKRLSSKPGSRWGPPPKSYLSSGGLSDGEKKKKKKVPRKKLKASTDESETLIDARPRVYKEDLIRGLKITPVATIRQLRRENGSESKVRWKPVGSIVRFIPADEIKALPRALSPKPKPKEGLLVDIPVPVLQSFESRLMNLHNLSVNEKKALLTEMALQAKPAENPTSPPQQLHRRGSSSPSRAAWRPVGTNIKIIPADEIKALPRSLSPKPKPKPKDGMLVDVPSPVLQSFESRLMNLHNLSVNEKKALLTEMALQAKPAENPTSPPQQLHRRGSSSPSRAAWRPVGTNIKIIPADEIKALPRSLSPKPKPKPKDGMLVDVPSPVLQSFESRLMNLHNLSVDEKKALLTEMALQAKPPERRVTLQLPNHSKFVPGSRNTTTKPAWKPTGTNVPIVPAECVKVLAPRHYIKKPKQMHATAQSREMRLSKETTIESSENVPCNLMETVVPCPTHAKPKVIGSVGVDTGTEDELLAHPEVGSSMDDNLSSKKLESFSYSLMNLTQMNKEQKLELLSDMARELKALNSVVDSVSFRSKVTCAREEAVAFTKPSLKSEFTVEEASFNRGFSINQLYLKGLRNLPSMTKDQKLSLLSNIADEVKSRYSSQATLPSAQDTSAGESRRNTAEISSRSAPEGTSSLLDGIAPKTIHSFQKCLKNLAKLSRDQKLELLSKMAEEAKSSNVRDVCSRFRN